MSKKNKHKNNITDQAPTTDLTPEDSSNTFPEETTEQTLETPLDTENQLQEMKQRLQRLGADYQNYQKRSQRQLELSTQFAREEVVKSLLPVLDNFEHALEKGSGTNDTTALVQGIRIVYDHMLSVLEGSGLRRIKVEQGDSFDPELHQALLHEENEQLPENSILSELARGYIMNAHTLRPAKVSVSKKSSDNLQQNDPTDTDGISSGDENTAEDEKYDE